MGPTHAQLLGAVAALLSHSSPSALAQVPVGTETPAGVQQQARMLSADPNAPVLSYGWWGGGVRGTLSLAVPLIGDPDSTGLSLTLLPLVELHNSRSVLPVPFQYWRGRVSLELGWRRPVHVFGRAATLGLIFGFEHESDHVTQLPGPERRAAIRSDYLAINDGVVRAALTLPMGTTHVTFELTGRAIGFACTRRSAPCDVLYGSASAEGAVSGVVEGSQVATGPGPFAALMASYLVANGQVGKEARAVLHVGMRYRRTPTGRLLQLFALASLGNDIGLLRERSRPQLGVGLRWAL